MINNTGGFDLGLIGIENLENEENSFSESLEKVKELPEWPFVKNRGLKKLVAYVKKFLLTTYGSDPNNSEYGSYLKKLIGTNYNNLEEIAKKINKEIKRVEKQIIIIQNNLNYYIPDEEKLKEVKLIKIYEEENNNIWAVNGKYRVVNQKGESYEGELFSKTL